MCNWGWALGPVGGVLVGREQKKKKQAQQQANYLAALMQQQLAQQAQQAQALQQQNDVLNNVNKAVNTDPIVTMDSLTNDPETNSDYGTALGNTSLKPKRTISTLSFPFRSGLNVR